ncbi:beta strand repeat-containing protein [Aestuariivirga sp.]|uniref:beta strand repeat-containing protein n=1 Tax=Aestuariivirga sp. TaxID=2650926 RepID=UPI003593552B
MTIFITGNTNQTIIGTSGSDDIFAVTTSLSDDRVFAKGGDDEVRGGFGDDLIFGGSGKDKLVGNDDNDRLFGGSDDDTMFGGNGNDVLAVETNLLVMGNDRLSGGDGFDRVVFETANILEINGAPFLSGIAPAGAGVFVNLASTFRAGFVGTISDVSGGSLNVLGQLSTPKGRITDTNGTTANFTDIEEFDLTSHTDHFIDSNVSHIIDGGAGNDFLNGRGGADTLDGGTGNDTAVYNSSATGVSVSLLDFGNGGSGSFGDAEGDRLFSIENVFGSNHDDFVLGDGNANILRGLDGNDQLIGGGGADTLDGGEGNDTLRGGTGNDFMNGGEGTDTALLIDWNGNKSALFTSFRGTIALADATNFSTAVLEKSTFNPLTRVTTVTTIETDTLQAIENVIASDFAETITGNASANTLEGRGGNDIIDGGKGSDTLIGGDGIDTAAFSSKSILDTARVTASLNDGTAVITRTAFINGSLIPTVTTETDKLSGFENLTGTSDSDSLTGSSGVNVLDGGNGNDTLAGLGGADRLVGGEGLDTADYQASSEGVTINLATGLASGGDATGDTFSGIENVSGSNADDVLTGSAGTNFINGNDGNDIIEGGAGADAMDGGTGSADTLTYASSSVLGVVMSLDGLFFASGDAAGDTAFNFENITGSQAGSDTLRGNSGNNTLQGLGGNDTLQGGDGADTLDGGEGFDVADYRLDGAIIIDLAAGIVDGKASGDTFISIEGFIAGEGDSIMRGDDANDNFRATSGTNNLQGRGGDDVLNGGRNRDTISGGDGNDAVNGGTGSDTLLGNVGDDTLIGDRGNDILTGGAGDDTLIGGLNADTFVFTARNSGQDIIGDFEDGIDTIQFDTPFVNSFGDLSIAGNGTDHVTVVFGGQSINIFSADTITLTAADFDIL